MPISDPWDGGSYPGASPFYEGTSVLSGMKVLQARGAITEYRWCENFNDLVLAVGYNGPVVLGLNWMTGMFTPDARGYIHATGDQAGGHCIVARGVNVKFKYFRLRNSWGPFWGGFGGDCFVSFADMEALFLNEGEAAVPMGRRVITI